jgi:transcription elongation factor SPT5
LILIWSFKTISVQEGAEDFIIFVLFERSSPDDPSPQVLSAFARDEIKGAVYIEARSLEAVRHILQGVPGVFHNSQGPCIDLVPLDERVSLLQSTKPTPIQRLSWVRITCGGKYRNRPALVKSVDLRLWTAQVLLAPSARVKTARQKKRLVLLGNTTDNYLLEQVFSLEDLSDRSVNLTESELAMFEKSHDELVTRALNARAVTLKLGDRVQVFTGSLQGLQGTIVELHDDTRSITFATADTSSTTTTSLLQVSILEVSKQFVRGDYVRVMYGSHHGQEGFILDMDDNQATIFNPQGADSEVWIHLIVTHHTNRSNSVSPSYAILIGPLQMKKYGKQSQTPSHHQRVAAICTQAAPTMGWR